jgi:hypothetical protein
MKMTYFTILFISAAFGLFVSVISVYEVPAFMISFVLLTIIKIATRNRVSIPHKEKWGKYLPYNEEPWDVPRRIVEDTKTWPDSREFLEAHGFTILGIVDRSHYRVQPPHGWKLESFLPEKGAYSYIKDDEGKKVADMHYEQKFYHIKPKVYLAKSFRTA